MDLEPLWATLDDRLLPMLGAYRRRLPTLQVSTKADNTLLSEADLAVQTTIVESILEMFPGSGFVAEEDAASVPREGDPMWVVDPIDGTSQFVNPNGREYCSVVCLLLEGRPSGAYVLAPELGVGGTPIRIHWSTAGVTVNDKPAPPLPARTTPVRASVTRSAGTSPRPHESELARIGCDMKLRTTSQTLDMVRACIDLSAWTEAPDEQFDFFYRPNQKVWDGAAGIGLGTAMGRLTRNGHGIDPIPLSPKFLAQPAPTFTDTITGDPGCVHWFLNLLETG